MPSKWASPAIVLVSLGGGLQAQRTSSDAGARPERPYIEATGEATVSAKPDQLLIDIAVVTQAPTAVAAGAQNAKQNEAVLAELRKIVTAKDQIKTISYSVRPDYKKPGFTAEIAGYTATNVVEVTLTDLSQSGKLIDAALLTGANNIQRLQYGLKNPQVTQSQALREAAVQAKANADAIAEGLGGHAGKPLSAEQAVRSGVAPIRAFAAAESVAASAPTQIQAGTVDVSATVTLRVELAQ